MYAWVQTALTEQRYFSLSKKQRGAVHPVGGERLDFLYRDVGG